jgi:hypothetical protein
MANVSVATFVAKVFGFISSNHAISWLRIALKYSLRILIAYLSPEIMKVANIRKLQTKVTDPKIPNLILFLKYFFFVFLPHSLVNCSI